jgi:hypothetical protein
MSMSLDHLLETVKPVLYETGNEDAPYSGCGTCFLVLHNKQTYIVTAKHVVNGNLGESLMVFPNRNTDLSIPINVQITIDNPDSFDTDYSDIVIYRIDHDQLHIEPGSVMRTVDFSKYDHHWAARHRDSGYYMLGFPVEHRIVNYEEYLVSSTQHLLTGRYFGPSASQYCHEIEFVALNGVTDLNGLSGSPVFCAAKGGTPRAATFCGMLLRGGAAARRAVFVDAFVINAMLDKVSIPNPPLNRTHADNALSG